MGVVGWWGTCNGTGTHVKPVRALQDVRLAAVGSVAVHEPGGAPGGGAVVLDVAQLEALLTRTFSIGLDAGRGREKVALVRLRLSRALPGAAGTQAMAAWALAIERGVVTEQIAKSFKEALRRSGSRADRTWSLGTPTPVARRRGPCPSCGGSLAGA